MVVQYFEKVDSIMLPVAPLMIEHRLIERIIAVLRYEVNRARETRMIDIFCIDNAVDFIRTYADQTHHGKEEDILFRELKNKELSDEHATIMAELIQEHATARSTTKVLVAAKERFVAGDDAGLDEMLENLDFLVNFYPNLIEKEDKRFFVQVMKYFTATEQEAMLMEGREYDRKMIHRRYERTVIEHEKERGITDVKMKSNWLDYI